MLATITILEFAASNPILAVIILFLLCATAVGLSQSIAHMVRGTPVPPPDSPFKGKKDGDDE